MKRFITGFVCGAVVFGAVGALAVEYNVTPNPFKVLVDGREVQMEGYNINDRSYFQLRDIGKAIGFSVGFVDGAVVLDSSGKPIDETQGQPEEPNAPDLPPVLNTEWTPGDPMDDPTLEDGQMLIGTMIWNINGGGSVKSSDGLAVHVDNNMRCVESTAIENKYGLVEKGYFISYDLTKTSMELVTSDWKYTLINNIPIVEKANLHIPLSYYENILKPYIQANFQ